MSSNIKLKYKINLLYMILTVSSEADDSHPYYTPKKNNSISNDDRTSSQIQAALDNFDSSKFVL